jgi:glycosidase
MAEDTPQDYRNLVIYEVFVRNHGPHGTFADVEADLPRIQSMGVDVVWFMPIHPIGQLHRKGSQGSPYAIADYRAVNPEYGTREDFKRLIARAHALGLKVMIDVVYNHTAADSQLVAQHPEWYHQDENGRPVTTVPEWSDVIDFDFQAHGLSEYLIETLEGWVEFGVDGFRCDVASLLPLDFWLEAREAAEWIKPGVIWLAESVHAGWVAERRALGFPMHSDAELYQAFDITYDYDIWPIWQAAVRSAVPVARYLEMVRWQDCIYPGNYVKLRCVENHDQPRVMDLASSRDQALAWTALQAFNKGALLIYAGQEAGASHRPSLFEIDKIEWNGYPLQPFFERLAHLKKRPVQRQGSLVWLDAAPLVQGVWLSPDGGLYGLFNLDGAVGTAPVQLPDGSYRELLTDATVTVQDGRVSIPDTAFVLEVNQPTLVQGGRYRPLFSPLLDYRSE